jgi:hypothetical protein
LGVSEYSKLTINKDGKYVFDPNGLAGKKNRTMIREKDPRSMQIDRYNNNDNKKNRDFRVNRSSSNHSKSYSF